MVSLEGRISTPPVLGGDRGREEGVSGEVMLLSVDQQHAERASAALYLHLILSFFFLSLTCRICPRSLQGSPAYIPQHVKTSRFDFDGLAAGQGAFPVQLGRE